MIITRLWGGLGNQLFQYAFGYAKSKEIGTNLVLDTRFYTNEFIKNNPRFTRQKLNLLNFPIEFKQTINENGELKKVNKLQGHRINQLLRIPYLSVLPLGNDMLYVKETRMYYQPALNIIKKNNVYYDGYWQTEKYFEKYRKEIIQQYSYNSRRTDKFVKENCVDQFNSIALHMRLGDFGKKHFTAHYNYVINPDYYKNAIIQVKSKIDNPRFFICSNDIQKAKEFIGNSSEYIYISGTNDFNDMDEFSIMMQCHHHIISNSTFSWWSAWLGEKDGSISIAPNIVFGNRNIIPKRWIKISVFD